MSFEMEEPVLEYKAVQKGYFVVSAGSTRAGSTWLYNAVRLLLNHRFGLVYGAWVGDFDFNTLAPARVVKVHEYHQDLADAADVTLTCNRDMRDVVASALRMQFITLDNAVEKARLYCDFHTFWSARSQLDLRYESIMQTPHTALTCVASTLGISIDTKALNELVERLLALKADSSTPVGKHDPFNLMHRDHRRSGKEAGWDQLPKSIRDEILNECASWLERNGYRTSDK